VSNGLQKIKRWFGRTENSAEDVAGGETAVATPAPGAPSAGLGDTDRETSTNAQVEGAVGEPWPGKD
jgi:hypothetical protein